MAEQIILACSDEGKFLEYIPKSLGHTGKGRRHLAITVVLQNSKGQVLLQRRKHKVFDNIWDFTASTHPLHLESGEDESLEEATKRALKIEYDIEGFSNLRNLGFFNYFKKIGNLCENEHCAMMVGEYDGDIKMDPKFGYEYKWVDLPKFLEDVEKNTKDYAPWVIEGVKIIKDNLVGDCC